jgi:hypothetical protein
MWPDKDGRETPAIDYFEPGNLYNHPAIVNYLKRNGGRPRNIAVEELNNQPDSSVIDYLKNQMKATNQKSPYVINKTMLHRYQRHRSVYT